MRSTKQSASGGFAIAVRIAFALAVLAALGSGTASGLVRAGVAVPPSGWLTPAVAAHAFLMVCAFMGTVIGIERAVAVKHPMAFLGPAASAVAGAAMLAGRFDAAAWTMAAASLAFVAVNAVVVRRQRAAHTVLLLVAALAWAGGCALYTLAPVCAAVVPLWFSFLVLTVAAERLEMARLMRRRPGVAATLHVIFGVLPAGAVLSAVSVHVGGIVYGLALVALSAWLAAFDIARRTVRAQGLGRYMAICLLLGYAWLFVAGAAWTATSLGFPLRDAALHALAIGFLFSMMLGHAPVILPAVARTKVLFGPVFYVALLLLHATLALRLVAGPFDLAALAAGAAGNAVAIGTFIATLAGSAVAWRVKFPPPSHDSNRGPVPAPR